MSTPPPADPPAAPSPEIDSAALDWFVRRGGGSIDAAEETLFQAWLAADARHRAAFAHWQRDWAALDALPPESLHTLRKRLSADKAAAHAAPPRRAWWRGLADWAPQGALAALLLTVVGGSYLAWGHWQQPLFTQSFATARGQQLDVALPDGSRLRLDTATRADVTFYRQRRELRLPEGQTVLQVKGDAARPFDVLAGPLRVTVVGTRFSVRYTPGLSDQEGVHVAVEEGRVRVARADRAASGAGAAVELGAGQQVASDAAGRLGKVSAVPTAGIAPWRESRVSFDNTPLARALAEFERYGPTHLVVRDPGVAALRVTGTFDPHRLDNFSRVLPQVLPVRLRAQDGVTEIVSSK